MTQEAEQLAVRVDSAHTRASDVRCGHPADRARVDRLAARVVAAVAVGAAAGAHGLDDVLPAREGHRIGHSRDLPGGHVVHLVHARVVAMQRAAHEGAASEQNEPEGPSNT